MCKGGPCHVPGQSLFVSDLLDVRECLFETLFLFMVCDTVFGPASACVYLPPFSLCPHAQHDPVYSRPLTSSQTLSLSTPVGLCSHTLWKWLFLSPQSPLAKAGGWLPVLTPIPTNQGPHGPPLPLETTHSPSFLPSALAILLSPLGPLDASRDKTQGLISVSFLFPSQVLGHGL